MSPLVIAAAALCVVDLVLTAKALNTGGAREVIWGFFGQDNALVTAIAGNLAIFVALALLVGVEDGRPWAVYAGARAAVVWVNWNRLRKIERRRYGR